MNVYERIKNYQPVNEQEVCDKEQMLLFMEKSDGLMKREETK